MTVVDESVEYDRYGRMKYHPDYHFNHGKPFTRNEMIYIAKYYDFDGRDLVGLALGRTPHTIQTKVSKMKLNGQWELYKTLDED